MEIKTFEKLFELKNELDLHKSTIEKLQHLQAQKVRYTRAVEDGSRHAEFKLTEDEWNAIVEAAIKMKEDRINEIMKEVEAI